MVAAEETLAAEGDKSAAGSVQLVAAGEPVVAEGDTLAAEGDKSTAGAEPLVAGGEAITTEGEKPSAEAETLTARLHFMAKLLQTIEKKIFLNEATARRVKAMITAVGTILQELLALLVVR